MHVWQGEGVTVINFPTKIDWRNKSKYSWITAGVARLFGHEIPVRGIRSIAVPALGCSLGGLDWKAVQQIIKNWYHVFDDVLNGVDVQIFGPA